jgi:predicted AlkP superfamily phosphohydrolase/phosphomutase
METLLLGLDGACRSVLAPRFEEGVMPRVEELFDEGTSGPLTSQLPPWTPSAWPSLYTGVNPGKHGVFGFLRFDGYDWDVVNRSDVREFALWELLDQHDMTSVVVNVPATHPAREFDGALLPGYIGPEDPACHPEGILADVEAAVGEYDVYGPLDKPGETDLDEVAAHAHSRGEAFCYLADRFDPDFGFLEFQQTDSVFHACPDDEDAVRRVFGAVDEAVGQVLDECDPETVIVVSDHGIGEYDGYDVRLNEYLREAGFVESTTDGTGMPSWDSIARNRLQDGDDGGQPDPGVAERLAATASRLGLTSQRIQAVLEPLGLAEFVATHAPTDAVRAGTEQVDFGSSRAFVRDRIELGVRLNVAGREPDGAVPADVYDDHREALIEALSELTTPDGEPAFESVVPREDVFSGPFVERAPDVVTVPREFDNTLNVSLLGDLFDEPFEPWNHKRDGVVAATGAAVDADAALADAHLFDVAPTVLASLDVPWSDRMDGSPLPIVEETPERRYPEFEADERDDTDDEAVEERLAHLGYLSGE